jgi:hypothetical protein
MSVSKEERYAMIRRAALKIQKRNKIRVSSAKLTKEVVRLDEQDYKADVRWQDGDRFVKDGYSDVYNSTMKEEWN